jgi:hypothetical protein
VNSETLTDILAGIPDRQVRAELSALVGVDEAVPIGKVRDNATGTLEDAKAWLARMQEDGQAAATRRAERKRERQNRSRGRRERRRS